MIPRERLLEQKEKIFVLIRAEKDNLIVSRFSGDVLYTHIKNHSGDLLVDETLIDDICNLLFATTVGNMLSYANRFKFVVMREK